MLIALLMLGLMWNLVVATFVKDVIPLILRTLTLWMTNTIGCIVGSFRADCNDAAISFHMLVLRKKLFFRKT